VKVYIGSVTIMNVKSYWIFEVVEVVGEKYCKRVG